MFARTVRFSFLLIFAFTPTGYAAKLPNSFNGFVTEVSSGQFQIGSRQVSWSEQTTQVYRLEQGVEMDAPPVAVVRVGAYLHVEGKLDKKTGRVLASSLGLLAPDGIAGKISGTGLIQEEPKLVSDGSGASGVIWADGYPLQVTAKTKLITTGGKPFPLGQIQPNVWTAFDAMRMPDGTLEARSITFEPDTVTADEVKYRDQSETEIVLPDYSNHTPGKIKFHYRGTPSIPWSLDILPDKAVQDYVTKVGESLVPQYQKDLPASDPRKINFRFFVVQKPSRWKETLKDASSTAGGVIYIPDNVLAALDNEAQLAALLSNCIAVTLEKQLYVHRTRGRIENGLAWTSDLTPGLIGLPVGIGNGIAAHQLWLNVNEQATRIGLRYMLHAGYDIREAPFAWDAAANKNAENPRSSDYALTPFQQSVLSDLYFNYASIDYSQLKTNREAYQQMLTTLRRDDPKLPKAKNHD